MHQGHFANPSVRLDRGAGSHHNSDMEKGESTGRMDLLPLTYGSAAEPEWGRSTGSSGSDYGKQEGTP